jgi:hypothetical protein
MIFPLMVLAVSVGAPTWLAEAPQRRPSIKVHDKTSGCFHSDVRDYEWEQRDGGFWRRGSLLDTEWVEALRKQILGSSGTPADLLAQAGITPASLASHREEILRTAWPESQPPKDPDHPILPPELEPLLSYDTLAPHILDELLSKNWSSTTNYYLSVEIPGDPVLKIRSRGLVPWKLPWTIEAGGKTWESCDLALSRSLARLLDAEGPNKSLIDGTRYWAEEFWKEENFWERFVGRALDAALSGVEYARLEGYVEAMDRFRVVDAQSGSINMQPESLFLGLESIAPSALDAAWWWNPLKDGQPTSTWRDFFFAYDAALDLVEKQAWLGEWKAAGPERTLEVHVVGRVGYAETMRDDFVVPPWKHAGFSGDPSFEILLRRKGNWCGTVWLSKEEPGALIETANGGGAGHWFDKLNFSFHPTEPTYGRVDGQGNFELRKIER